MTLRLTKVVPAPVPTPPTTVTIEGVPIGVLEWLSREIPWLNAARVRSGGVPLYREGSNVGIFFTELAEKFGDL